MNPFRARWPDRAGFILAIVGVSLGMGVVHQLPFALTGVELLVWLVAMATLVIPALVLELAIGVIFQGALSESLRKSDKRLEVIGWVSAGVAFLALVAAGAVVGDLSVSGYESLLATLSDQPLPWASQPGTQAASHHTIGSVLIAVSAVMAFIDLRLWRGAPSIARTARATVPAGLVALMVLIAVLSTGIGAVDGVSRWLSPGPEGWSSLISLHTWGHAYAYALSTWMLGLGVYTAFGSYLNRSSDVTGITGVSVLAAGLCQMLLMLVVFTASGLSGSASTSLTPDVTIAAVPGAIAAFSAPLWVRGLLATIWFAALLAFAMPALLALAEAVVAPIADKFRVPRERAVAWVCLAAFFSTALVAVQRSHAWQIGGDAALLACAGVLIAILALATWWRVELDALQRHLNAYSAFRVGGGWRVLARILVPLGAIAVAIDQAVGRLAAAAPGTTPTASGLHVSGACAILVVLILIAWVVSRLPGRGGMKAKQALVVGQATLGLALVVALWSAAQDQARTNALTSFRHYRADWEESWRKPVEDLANSTLNRLLRHPERDPELAEAALSVMRRSLSWYVRAPTVANRTREWLEQQLARQEGDGDALHPAFDILEIAEADDIDSYRARIAALAGDRTVEASALAVAAAKLQAEPGSTDADLDCSRLATAWRALHAVRNGRKLNWLAQEQPVVASAERQATVAVVAHLRALLDPYLGKSMGVYGETLPDEHMLALLEANAEGINRTTPHQQERVRRARLVLAEFAPRYHFEPVVDTACTTALRYHTIPGGGFLIVLTVVGSLVGGLWFALVRMVRGPMPVDVNAETMENVEPIDLDTDAETKSRSSGSITDVG